MSRRRDWLCLSDETELMIKARGRNLLVMDVLRAVSVESGLSVTALLGSRGNKQTARARQLVMLIAHDTCHWMSYPRIGRILGGRDHTTIVHGCKAARRRLGEIPEYEALYQAAVARLNDGCREAAE